jgi:ATP-dependent helicase YprA (DUF1998 family)
VVEALRLAASRVLQIDEGELGGNWVPVAGAHGGAVDLFVYDTLPGGAGYARLTLANLPAVLEMALSLLENCDGNCPSACYRCILHYGNRFFHHGLDRHVGAALLAHILRGTTPELSQQAAIGLAETLGRVIKLRGTHIEIGQQLPVPLVVKTSGKPTWVAIHHALSDGSLPSSLKTAARQAGAALISIDAFTIQHDLPGAVERVFV